MRRRDRDLLARRDRRRGRPSPYGRRDPRHPFGRRSYDNPPQADYLRMAAYGFLGGFALGMLVWSQQVHQHRTGLFSRSPLRRLAALGYLGGQPSVDTARLLRDYIAWEHRPTLRRRGQSILRQMEQSLE